jgi:hypothetical protein
MMISVYSKARGARTLKDGVTLESYQEKYPDAIQVDRPSNETLTEWMNDGGCESIDGCWTEPDGTCEHGHPSWLMALGLI